MFPYEYKSVDYKMEITTFLCCFFSLCVMVLYFSPSLLLHLNSHKAKLELLEGKLEGKLVLIDD